MTRALCCLTLLTLGCGGSDPEHPAYGLTGSASDGADVYADTCASCHGADGSGGTGSALTETGPGMSRTEIIDILIDGIPGTSMVSYRSILTAQEIADVAAYVEREWGS